VGQDLRSPQRHVLRQLEGNPADIDRQARDLVDAAQVMRSVATRLQRLADGTDTVSQAESMDQGAKKLGPGALEWAANNAKEISGVTKGVVGFEVGLSFIVAGDFVADENVSSYSEWRNQW